jgi:hypothetical protein
MAVSILLISAFNTEDESAIKRSTAEPINFDDPRRSIKIS